MGHSGELYITLLCSFHKLNALIWRTLRWLLAELNALLSHLQSFICWLLSSKCRLLERGAFCRFLLWRAVGKMIFLFETDFRSRVTGFAVTLAALSAVTRHAWIWGSTFVFETAQSIVIALFYFPMCTLERVYRVNSFALACHLTCVARVRQLFFMSR